MSHWRQTLSQTLLGEREDPRHGHSGSCEKGQRHGVSLPHSKNLCRSHQERGWAADRARDPSLPSNTSLVTCNACVLSGVHSGRVRRPTCAEDKQAAMREDRGERS